MAQHGFHLGGEALPEPKSNFWGLAVLFFKLAVIAILISVIAGLSDRPFLH